MTPEERDLIAGLFDRIRSTRISEKDREADAFIAQMVRQTPDAAYMLVQSVLVQDHALQEADTRMQDLEDRVRELEGDRPRQSSGGGSFLGGLFGGNRGSEPRDEPRGSGSVPSIGSRGSPSVYDSRGGDRGAPWGGQPPPSGGYGQPEPPRGGGGGGFLRGAVSTAAGVAGGMLLANTFRDMLGGGSGHAHAAGSSETKSGEHSPYEVNADSDKKDNQAQHASYQDENDNDPGNYDADDSSDDSDDSGGDDTEV